MTNHHLFVSHCVCVCVVVSESEVQVWKIQDQSSICHGWDAFEGLHLSACMQTHAHSHHAYTKPGLVGFIIVLFASAPVCFPSLINMLREAKHISRKGWCRKHSLRYSLSSSLTFNSLRFLNTCRFSFCLTEGTDSTQDKQICSLLLSLFAVFAHTLFILNLNNVDMTNMCWGGGVKPSLISHSSWL